MTNTDIAALVERLRNGAGTLAQYHLEEDVLEAADALEALQSKLEQIRVWCDAYPVADFPEPDWIKARDLLKTGGMFLDNISASNMRHVLNGVLKILDGNDD